MFPDYHGYADLELRVPHTKLAKFAYLNDEFVSSTLRLPSSQAQISHFLFYVPMICAVPKKMLKAETPNARIDTPALIISTQFDML